MRGGPYTFAPRGWAVVRRIQSFVRPGLFATALCALALLGACAKPLPQRGSPEWTRKLERGDLLVDEREVPDTGLKFITTTGLVDAPPEVVWEALQDAGEFRRFLYLVEDSEELNRRGGKRQFRVVIRIDPFSRVVTGDIIIIAVVEESIDYDAGVWRAEYTSVEGSSVKRAYGAWEIEEYEGNRSIVSFSVFIDVGLPGTLDAVINTYSKALVDAWADDLRDYVVDRGVRAELQQKAALRAARRAARQVQDDEPPRGSRLEDLLR